MSGESNQWFNVHIKTIKAAVQSNGWLLISHAELIHIVPADELYTHTPLACSCQPVDVVDENMCIHNSFDGRESFENGTRLPS